VITNDAGEVTQIIRCFDAEWAREHFDPGGRARLIWCNNNGRERIAQFIDRARETIFVQNERYQDPVIIERLVRARERGVKVHVMARPPHTLKQEKLIEGVSGLRIMHDVGIKVRKVKHLKLHAKMLLADRKVAIIGSINFAPGSFDARRELAIEVRDKNVVRRLEKVARHDWRHSHPLDLSDEGLLADLEKRHTASAGAHELVLAGGVKSAAGKSKYKGNG
jgi:cardiolipin synthase